jgi:heme-degrading monooxygenase HmoA
VVDRYGQHNLLVKLFQLRRTLSLTGSRKDRKMFARVVTSQMKPDKAEDAVALWQEKLMPMIKGMNGFRGAYLLGDPASGHGLTITLWESKEDAQILAETFAKNIAHFADLMVAEPSVAEYEVMLTV